jgi:hypothetical protein
VSSWDGAHTLWPTGSGGPVLVTAVALSVVSETRRWSYTYSGGLSSPSLWSQVPPWLTHHARYRIGEPDAN